MLKKIFVYGSSLGLSLVVLILFFALVGFIASIRDKGAYVMPSIEVPAHNSACYERANTYVREYWDEFCLIERKPKGCNLTNKILSNSAKFHFEMALMSCDSTE